MAMKITPEELARLGEPSIAFKDGSGYLAEMAVFHELHCIVRISRPVVFWLQVRSLIIQRNVYGDTFICSSITVI
jgi:hypothetical protein